MKILMSTGLCHCPSQRTFLRRCKAILKRQERHICSHRFHDQKILICHTGPALCFYVQILFRFCCYSPAKHLVLVIVKSSSHSVHVPAHVAQTHIESEQYFKLQRHQHRMLLPQPSTALLTSSLIYQCSYKFIQQDT